jgi:phosphoribosyl isomerase A
MLLPAAEAGAEWLHVVDLDAAFEGEPRNRHVIAAIVDATGLPVQASGGIRSMADLDASVAYGASRVVIGTMALEEPAFVAAAVAEHGDKVAVGLDAEGTTLKARGWTASSGDLFEALRRFTLMGVARFVFTDIARDGMLTGPNVERLAEVAETYPWQGMPTPEGEAEVELTVAGDGPSRRAVSRTPTPAS